VPAVVIREVLRLQFNPLSRAAIGSGTAQPGGRMRAKLKELKAEPQRRWRQYMALQHKARIVEFTRWTGALRLEVERGR
jgi:hypothetical protein